MQKKGKTNKQNIAIIILSVLLLISIAFGATYSYFNGKTNLIQGSVTTATLSVELQDHTGSTTGFSLSTGTDKVIPGQGLANTSLYVQNNSAFPVYCAIKYYMEVYDEDEYRYYEENQTGLKPNEKEIMEDVSALAFRPDAISNNWYIHKYQCVNETGNYQMLVCTEQIPRNSRVAALTGGALMVPYDWRNDMQNCRIIIHFQAFVIQADYLENVYPDIASSDLETKIKGIAEAIVTERTDLDVKTGE